MVLSITMTGKRRGGRPKLWWINNISSHLEGRRRRGRPWLHWLNNISSHLEGKRPRGGLMLRWINNISSHLEGRRRRGRPWLHWFNNISSHLEGRRRQVQSRSSQPSSSLLQKSFSRCPVVSFSIWCPLESGTRKAIPVHSENMTKSSPSSLLHLIYNVFYAGAF